MTTRKSGNEFGPERLSIADVFPDQSLRDSAKIFTLYVIEFPNRKRYFGITSRTLEQRWSAHLSRAKKTPRRPICAALLKYPEAKIRPLVVGPASYIVDLEIKMIAACRTDDREFGYNFGAGGDIGPMLGKNHDADALSKISIASKLRPRLPESNAKTSARLKGHPVSQETRKKISAATKEAMATLEIRAKMRTFYNSRIGQPLHPNLLAAITGKPLSKKHKAKLAVALKGRTFSDETRAKMSEGKRLSWARKKAALDASVVKGFS